MIPYNFRTGTSVSNYPQFPHSFVVSGLVRQSTVTLEKHVLIEVGQPVSFRCLAGSACVHRNTHCDHGRCVVLSDNQIKSVGKLLLLQRNSCNQNQEKSCYQNISFLYSGELTFFASLIIRTCATAASPG